MKKFLLLFFLFAVYKNLFGIGANKILNKSSILPPPKYFENSSPIENVDFNNKNLLITKWGVVENNSNLISPIGEHCENSVPNQFFLKTDAPLTRNEIDELLKKGIKVLGFIPYNFYLVKVDKDKFLENGNLSLFGFSPLFKIDPALYKTNFPVNPILTIYLDKEIEYHIFLKKIEKIFQQVEFVSYFDSFDSVLRIYYEGKNLKDLLEFLASCEETIFIEPFFLPELLNDNSIYVVQSYDTNNKTNYSICATIWNQGLTGTDETPAVCDTGIDSDMCFFRLSSDPSAITDAQYPSLPNNGTIDFSKKIIVYNVLPGASAYDGSYTCPSGYHHGTHVCSSVVGDDYLTLSTPTSGGHDTGDGMAPNAKLIFQDAGLEDIGCLNGLANDYQLIFKQAYDAGARIHSNSWGSSVGGLYDGDARSVDLFTYLNDDFLFFFAAGNNGSSGSYTIISPGSAKNVVTVGATTNGSAGSNSLTSFSSKGPCLDGRIKPDVVAPGQYIVGASADEIHNSNNCSTRSASGTSMATPTTAGAATLLREYFRKGYYPTGTVNSDNLINPSSALLKAALINGAVETSATSQSNVLNLLNPDNNQGWGRVILDTVLFFSNPSRESRGLRIWDIPKEVGLSNGEEDTYSISITSSSEPLKVTLCWTDPPPSPLSGIALSHDLDLEVISPSNTIYKGNCFSSGSSYPNGIKDYLNNVEEVFITNPETGIWQIKIKGAYIPFIPVFGNSEKQGYAVVATFKDCGGCSLTTSNLSAVDNTSTGIDLSWEEVYGATKYQIFRAEGDCSSSPESFKLISECTLTTFTDTKVQGGKTYSYKIRVLNDCAEGPFSQCASTQFSGSCSLKPSFSGISSASSSNCSIQLAWSTGISNCPNSSSVSYNIYKSTTPNFEPSLYTLFKSGVSGTTYTDTQIFPNQTYYYIVRCEDSTTSNGGPANGGNEDSNRVVKYCTVHSTTYSYGTFFDDGGDTNSLLSSDSLWEITDEINHTTNGKYCYHSGERFLDYTNGSCAAINSEEIALQPSSTPILSFYCNYNIEYGYDGVVVEISNDGGNSFSPLTPIEGYPYSFAQTGNPPGNSCGYSSTQGAFTGPSTNSSLSGWTFYSFDLSPYSGNSVILRWRLSSDAGVTYRGFFLDDITITNAALFDDCYNSDGSILLDKTTYCPQETISISLFDSDIAGSGTQNVSIYSDTETTAEIITLYENPSNSGRFEGTIQTTQNPPSSDGMLSIEDNDLITATYLDFYDGTSSNVIKYSKALSKCVPDEIAKGFSQSDIQYFSEDKIYQRWPEFIGASKYRLYRGTLSTLPNLLNGDTNSCLVYEGTVATAPCPEDPALTSGRLYWYLVTAVNEAGEGSAGNSSLGERIINYELCK